MFEIVSDAILRAVRGEGLGLRLRVKPSWSGRVYGTYHLGARHFALAALFAFSTLGLFVRLLTMNLADPGLELEAASLRRANAHAIASREIVLPGKTDRLDHESEDLYARAHQLQMIIGIRDEATSSGGLGRISEPDEPAPVQAAGGAGRRIERLSTEVTLLRREFERLDREGLTREEEFRYTPSIVPVFEAEFVPTSTYGPRISPFTKQPEVHRGQDLAAALYSKLVATADGTVIAVERDASRSHLGRYVVIDHGGRFQTYYGHCERLFVEVGDTVRRHQIIAEMGNTGRSTGPHVHYEVRRDGAHRDPRIFMVFDPHFSSEEHIQVD